MNVVECLLIILFIVAIQVAHRYEQLHHVEEELQTLHDVARYKDGKIQLQWGLLAKTLTSVR